MQNTLAREVRDGLLLELELDLPSVLVISSEVEHAIRESSLLTSASASALAVSVM